MLENSWFLFPSTAVVRPVSSVRCPKGTWKDSLNTSKYNYYAPIFESPKKSAKEMVSAHLSNGWIKVLWTVCERKSCARAITVDWDVLGRIHQVLSDGLSAKQGKLCSMRISALGNRRRQCRFHADSGEEKVGKVDNAAVAKAQVLFHLKWRPRLQSLKFRGCDVPYLHRILVRSKFLGYRWGSWLSSLLQSWCCSQRLARVSGVCARGRGYKVV